MAQNPYGYLTPDAYQAESDDPLEEQAGAYQNGAMYRRRPYGGGNVGMPRPRGSGPVGPVRYSTATPREYVAPTAPTNTPETSPNRGGFNQAEGVTGPDYSTGERLREQARKLQNPSLWKKLVNGDEGLATQAEHKYRLAQYEDLAAENKYRAQHPELFAKPDEVAHASGIGLYKKRTGEIVTPEPQKPEKKGRILDKQDPESGYWYQRHEDEATWKPAPAERPDTTGPKAGSPDDPSSVSPGYTSTTHFKTAIKEKEFAEKAKQSQVYQDKSGRWVERVFDPGTGKSIVRPSDLPEGATKDGKGTGGTKAAGGWTPEKLEKMSERFSGWRRAAEMSGDPAEMKAAEARVQRALNTAGLTEDEATGAIQPLAAGAEKPAVNDVRPGDTIRNTAGRKTPIPEGTVIEKNGKRFKKLRGKWVEYTGTK